MLQVMKIGEVVWKQGLVSPISADAAICYFSHCDRTIKTPVMK